MSHSVPKQLLEVATACARLASGPISSAPMPWFFGAVVVVAVGLVAVAVGVLDEPFVAGVGVAEGVSVAGEVDC